MPSLSDLTFLQSAYERRLSSQLQGPRGRPKRRAPVKKSHRFLFNACSYTHDGGSSELGTSEPEPASYKIGEIARVEMLNIVSFNSVDTEQHENAPSSNGDPSKQSKISEENYLFEEKLRQVILIDGNRTFMAGAKPWPKYVRESALDAYKLPNPKLTQAELMRQKKRVAERRAIVAELSKEKINRRDRIYSDGIYFLPKRLMNESKARLAIWYRPKGESAEGEEIPKKAKPVGGK